MKWYCGQILRVIERKLAGRVQFSAERICLWTNVHAKNNQSFLSNRYRLHSRERWVRSICLTHSIGERNDRIKYEKATLNNCNIFIKDNNVNAIYSDIKKKTLTAIVHLKIFDTSVSNSLERCPYLNGITFRNDEYTKIRFKT